MNCISRPHKLYVIGNGFDLHHGLPCSYSDFEVWLQENRPDVYRNMNRIYGECHDGMWSVFEHSLAGFNLDDYPVDVTRAELIYTKLAIFTEAVVELYCHLRQKPDLSKRMADEMDINLEVFNLETDFFGDLHCSSRFTDMLCDAQGR